MATPPAEQLANLRDGIQNGDRPDGMADDDRDVLIDFSDQLKLRAAEYSDHRHVKLLRHCTRMAENVVRDGAVLAPALDDRDAAETIVRWIHDTYDNPETNRDYRVALRVFGKTLKPNDGEPPESIKWVSSKTPKSYDPAPDPAALFDWDDVDAMSDAARNSRDAAMVQLMMDAGPRGGEFFDMTVNDLTDSDHGLRLRVDGKTGQRSVTLIPSVPYVNDWLRNHPGGSDDPLWSQLTETKRLSKQRVYQILNRLAERADIDTDRKPATPTNFRKSNASWLARTGANASLIEERQGRKRGSKAVARYVATFGEENEESAYARLHGRTVDADTPERRDVVDCPRCDKENPPTEDRCMWCGQGLDPQGVAEGEQIEKSVRELLAKLSEMDPDAVQNMATVVNAIDDEPAIRAAFRAAAGD